MFVIPVGVIDPGTSRSARLAFWADQSLWLYFGNFEDGFAIKPIPPLNADKSAEGKTVPPALAIPQCAAAALRAASNRLPVTSGASSADASRSRANKDAASNRNAGIHASGASRDGSTRNSGRADANTSDANRGDTRNSGMAGNASGASKAGANSRTANIPWRRLWIVYQRRQAQAHSQLRSTRITPMPEAASIG
jgi:hypothetical protein